MGLEASHFIGEISVGIIELYNIVIYIINHHNYNASCMYIGGFHASQVWWHPWLHAMKTLLTFAVGICILQPMWKMRRPSTFHREKNSSEQTELKHLCTTQKKSRKTDQRNIWILWNPLTFVRWRSLTTTPILIQKRAAMRRYAAAKIRTALPDEAVCSLDLYTHKRM